MVFTSLVSPLLPFCSLYLLQSPQILKEMLCMWLSDPKSVLQSWDPTLVYPCTWFHVTCDSSYHVVRLDLGNCNISGTLGPELGELDVQQKVNSGYHV